MNFLRKLLLTAAIIFNFSVFSLALTQPAFAQDAQQEIQNGLCAGANLELSDGNCAETNQSGLEQVNKVVHSVINVLSLIVGLAAVVMIIIGGLRYITSGGSDTSVTSAKNTILYAIIGLVIVALAQVMVRFVLRQVTQ